MPPKVSKHAPVPVAVDVNWCIPVGTYSVPIEPGALLSASAGYSAMALAAPGMRTGLPKSLVESGATDATHAHGTPLEWLETALGPTTRPVLPAACARDATPRMSPAAPAPSPARREPAPERTKQRAAAAPHASSNDGGLAGAGAAVAAFAVLVLVLLCGAAIVKVDASVKAPGAVLAGTPGSVVAFLPPRDMAWIEAGASARIEVESLPVAEFGAATARVTRVSADIAEPEQLATAFGATVPSAYARVELALVAAPHPALEQHIRAGERLTVRIHRREQRLLGVLFGWLAQGS